MKKLLVVCIIILCASAVSAQENQKSYKYANYTEMRTEFGKLFQQKEYEKAAEILEWGLVKFSDHLQANSFNLAYIYLIMKEYDKSMDALEYGFDHGTWYNMYAMQGATFAAIKETERFKKIAARNEEFRLEAQKKLEPKTLVLRPDGYDPLKKYPVFIALHGGSSNAEAFKEMWITDKMRAEFIIVYPQSSGIVDINGYSWTVDPELSRIEISETYNKIIKDYSINVDEVVIGGFSAGGVASLEAVFCNDLPSTGFIVLCPVKSEVINQENIGKTRDRGVSGTILTSEMDPSLPHQKELNELLKENGFDHRFIITPNIGHWFPKDFKEQIDTAIKKIRENKKKTKK